MNVNTFIFPKVFISFTNLFIFGVINNYTAFENIFMFIFSSSYLKFSIVTLFIFCTNETISFYNEKYPYNSSLFTTFFSKNVIEMNISFYSFIKHSIVISSPRYLILWTTLYNKMRTVMSLMLLSEMLLKGSKFSYLDLLT